MPDECLEPTPAELSAELICLALGGVDGDIEHFSCGCWFVWTRSLSGHLCAEHRDPEYPKVDCHQLYSTLWTLRNAPLSDWQAWGEGPCE